MKKPPATATREALACFYFSRGLKVEVCNEQGAWLPAHVLDSNSNPSPVSLRNRKRHLLVQYETLVSEDDASKPLEEEVDVELVRPAPPEEEAREREEGFEARDAVDAFQLDGWWRGVVMRVEGDMYTVGFKSPPDLLEVRRVDLRRHWEWTEGAWVKEEKETMMRLDFIAGDEVEVNLHDDCLLYAWTPAIYVGPLGGNSFLISYEKRLNSTERAVVSDYQIRPRPPQQEEQTFDLLSLVDANFNMSWWVGDIIAVLAGEKYTVKFRYTMEEIEFSRSKLRQHMEWSGTKWMVPEESMVNGEQSRYAKGSNKNSEEGTRCTTRSRMKHSTVSVDESPCGSALKKLNISHFPENGTTFSSPTPSKKLKGKHAVESLSQAALSGRATPFKEGEDYTKFLLKMSQQQPVGELEKTIPGKKRGRVRKTPVNGHPPSVEPNGRKAKKSSQTLEGDHVINWIESSGSGEENEVMGGSRSGTFRLQPMEGNEQHAKDGASREMKLKRKWHVIVAKDPKAPTTGSEDSMRHAVAADSVVKVQLAASQMTEKEPDHDQTSSLIIKEVINSVNTMERSIRRTVTETEVEDDAEQEECPHLPFVKTTALWENIESMEVFKKYPQKPHFRPLLKTKGLLREGSAFGQMLVFAALVDQTTRLSLAESRDVIDSNLEATVELEMHGFDVHAIKHRLTKVLAMKVRLDELENQSKVVETKIAERSQNTGKETETISKIDKEIKDLEENIKVLKAKRAKVMTKCSGEDSEANKLRSEAGVINEGIKSIHRSFEVLAASPL